MTIKENVFRVKKKIEYARTIGKKQSSVKLVVVTKNRNLEEIKQVLETGEKNLGENRAQELIEKASVFPSAVWHFVGHLQSNKVTEVVKVSELIHSVDSIKLLRRINDAAREFDKVQEVLLEVNVSGEKTKFGFAPSEIASVLDTLRQLPFQNIRVKGLMTMAPLVEPEKTRPVFKALFSLSQELQLRELSMGMSNDYIVAVEEGATIVRIGTKIFE